LFNDFINCLILVIAVAGLARVTNGDGLMLQ